MAATTIGMATVAQADPLICARAIARASAAYVQARAKALQHCEDEKTRGALSVSTVCTADPPTATRLAKATTKLFGTVNVGCGGPDRNCGDADDEPLGPVGWGPGTVCPDVEHAGCTNAIATCTDVSKCLQCIDDEVVDRTVALYYGADAIADFASGDRVNRCQQAIGTATAKYLLDRSTAIEKCEDARFAGVHQNPCPTPGDGRAGPAIAKAERKKVLRICRACGGSTRACGDPDALVPAAFGFVSACPAVTPVGASACGGAIATLDDVVACVDCVTDFATGCTDAAAVPELVGTLPATCNPATTSTTTSTQVPTTTTTSSTSTSTSTTNASTTTTTAASTSTTSSMSPSTTTQASTTTTTVTSTTTTTIVSCTAATTHRPFSVSFAVPDSSVIVQGLTLLIDYPASQVTIPGSGTATSVRQSIINVQSGALSSPNDLDYALREQIAGTSNPLTPGQLFTINFLDCLGATPPTAADFTCTVEVATDPLGLDDQGVTCSVSGG
jgi:hypothetical protein